MSIKKFTLRMRRPLMDKYWDEVKFFLPGNSEKVDRFRRLFTHPNDGFPPDEKILTYEFSPKELAKEVEKWLS